MREHELHVVSLTDPDYPKLLGLFEEKRQPMRPKGYAGLEDAGLTERVLVHHRELDLSGCWFLRTENRWRLQWDFR